MDISALERIGLTKSEAKVYATLLTIGSSTSGPIMNHARVSSSKIYGILLRLIERGLVSYTLKGKTKYYQASTPEVLNDYMNEKEEELRDQRAIVKEILPQLKGLQKLTLQKECAQLYIGWKGMMNAFNSILDALNEGEEYIAFAQTGGEETSSEVKQFFHQYQRKREEKKLSVKLIAHESERKVFSATPYSQFRRFHVRYVKHCPPGIVIFGDHIFISAFEENPMGVIIGSREMAKAYRNYFYSAWSEASQ